MTHRHAHTDRRSPDADHRWLLAALGVVVTFMVAEVVAGVLAHSLALIADAGHMLTDAAALALAVVAIRLARRPASGAYTYGLTRVDALSGQANGIILLLLAAWFAVEGVRRLVTPAPVQGATVAVVALVGALVNVVATSLASRADRSSLNISGVLAHLVTDIWAFAATLVAGLIVLTTGWTRADAVATLAVAALMSWTGGRLVQRAGRVFLEAAPSHVDPGALGRELVDRDGVAQVHDLHVWTLGSSEVALSAHVLVHDSHDCHEVAARLRHDLAETHGIGHVTLQVEHASDPTTHMSSCVDTHGEVHVPAAVAPSGEDRPLSAGPASTRYLASPSPGIMSLSLSAPWSICVS